ncbi:AEC family transporter [Mollicutes bacterium LVI A0039]|nr:AEC family transporter [Mollicutes bacterium LVI A0039]
MFTVALSTMTSLFICIFVGFYAAKRKLIDEVSIDKLNIFLLNITFPFMIISIFNIELTPDVIEKGIPIFIYGLAYQAILIVIAWAFLKVVKFDAKQKDVVQFSMIFTNIGFVGLPLIAAVLGNEGLLFASLLNIPFNISCFTLGVYLLQPKGENHINPKTIFFTPSMISIWIGLTLLLSQAFLPGTFTSGDQITRLPVFLSKTISMIGGITSPLAMIIVGASLEQTNFKRVFSDVKLHVFSLIKLLVAPLIVYAICGLFISDPQILLIVSIFAGLPTATIGTVLAERFGQDYVYASEIVFLTTLYSLVTIPILFLIFG